MTIETVSARLSGVVAAASLTAALTVAMTVGATGPGMAQDLEEVTFGTNWLAQGEHGGFYYAVANGLYEERGLDVTIRMGGPQINHSQMLASGRIDFNMGGNLFASYNYVNGGIPVVTVAAIMQKEPQVLIAHPGKYDHPSDMTDAPMLIAAISRDNLWLWLKSAFGYTDDQLRPYTFNMGPFLANEDAAQQGYLSSEPYAIEQAAGFSPDVFLLADYGYNTYATTIETQQATVDERPEVVQAFVDASILGWYGYLNDGMDSETVQAANAMILDDNADMTEDKIANSIDLMNEYGIVDSGDSLELGVGAMTDERWGSFFDFAVENGIYDEDLDWQAAYTLEFVNKGVGL